MRVLRALLLVLAAVAVSSSHAFAQGADPNPAKRPLRVTIYPILVQAPIFGASIDLPSLPSLPPGGGGGGGGDSETGEVTGSTDVSLNAAYMAGFLVETNRFFVEGSGTWAKVSADRVSPRFTVSTDSWLVVGRAGYRLWKDVYATGGLHHISTSVDATLTLPIVGREISGHVKPSLNDPMIGGAWRPQFGRWSLDAAFEGGGFGVGSDVDLTGSATADYRLGHFDLRIGYEIVHMKYTVADVNIGSFSRQFIFEQTLHGPTIGFGLVF